MKKYNSLTNATRQISRRGALKKLLGFGLTVAASSLAAGSFSMTRGNSRAAGRSRIQWQTHEVAKIRGGYQGAVADVNGDGRLDILGLSADQSVVEWYENPTWTARPITTATQRNISLAPLFLPGTPARGVALASDFALGDTTHGSVWWAEPTTGPGLASSAEWRLSPIGKLPSTHRLRWANLDGTGHKALVDEPLLGYGAVAPSYNGPAPITWFEMPETLLRGHASAHDVKPQAWASHLIDNSLTVVHGLTIVDWDGDGRDEILTASFEGVHLLHSSGHAPNLTWTRTHLGEGDQKSGAKRGAGEVGTGKVGGKRFLATIEPWHGDKVVVYTEGKQGEMWSRHVIDPTFQEGHALACADLDGDGNDEIVAGFRGPGTSVYVYYAADSSGANWERQLLDADMGASGMAIADINGDGRPDVVVIGASATGLKWYENRPA
jgi:hypothetical protein